MEDNAPNGGLRLSFSFDTESPVTQSHRTSQGPERAGIEALKTARERLCATLQSEVKAVEEALHSEYDKVENAFEALSAEAALRAEQAAVEDARIADLRQLEWDKVAAGHAKLEDEKAAMEGIQAFHSSRIKLNIGGKRFETSRSTLCAMPESMLAAMSTS